MARVFKLKINLNVFKKEFCGVYMFLLTLLNTVVNTQVTLSDNSHGELVKSFVLVLI